MRPDQTVVQSEISGVFSLELLRTPPSSVEMSTSLSCEIGARLGKGIP